MGPYAPRPGHPDVLRLRRGGRREPRADDGGVRRPREVPDRRPGAALKLRLHFRFRVGYTPAMDELGLDGGFDWEDAEDITALSEEDLRGALKALCDEERRVSYRRRVLKGRLDLIRAELLGRGSLVPSPEELARVLLGDTPDE